LRADVIERKLMPISFVRPGTEHPPMQSTSRTDRLLSICAIISALAAVVIAVYEVRSTREFQRLSVWPNLVQYNSHVPGQAYTRNLANNGMGPAVIRSFRVYVDGEPKTNWMAVMESLIGEVEPELIYSTVHPGKVVLPGTAEAILQLPAGERATRFWQAMQQGRIATHICFCSLYHDCWVAEAGEEPQPIRGCRSGGSEEFRQ
jgi:hypothetical protein